MKLKLQSIDKRKFKNLNMTRPELETINEDSLIISNNLRTCGEMKSNVQLTHDEACDSYGLGCNHSRASSTGGTRC